MSDSKIINLLERLSVVVPERCWLNSFEHSDTYNGPDFAVKSDLYSVRVSLEGKPINLPHILMAVLEEAHERAWEWNIWRGAVTFLHSSDLVRVMTVSAPTLGGILEREVLPRLECLVLACEANQ